MLPLATKKDCHVHHMGMKSMFLNEELAEVVFVKQLSGFVVRGKEHKVLQLRKALYGLW